MGKRTRYEWKVNRHAEAPNCEVCGVQTVMPDAETRLIYLSEEATVDHHIPLCMGGEDSPTNYRLLCKKCNREKGGRSPDGRVKAPWGWMQQLLDA